MFTRPRRRPASPEELQQLSTATRQLIEYRGLSLVAWSWGSGPTVLLLHGWESRAGHMAAFVPWLTKAGFRAVALDAPGHGDSEGEVTDVMDYGKAVRAAADRLGPIAAVIAHSVGAAAAQYAYAHGLRVNASVLMCGPTSLTRVIQRTGVACGLDGAGISCLEALLCEHIGDQLSVMDLEALQVGRTHPALILHDPDDREMPVSESYALAAVWPGSQLLLVPGVGHRRIVASKDVVALTVDFLTTTTKEERSKLL